MSGISLSIWTSRFLSWSFQVLFGPSKYWIESSICDKLKHQKRCSEVLFFLECVQTSGWPFSSPQGQWRQLGPLRCTPLSPKGRGKFIASEQTILVRQGPFTTCMQWKYREWWQLQRRKIAFVLLGAISITCHYGYIQTTGGSLCKLCKGILYIPDIILLLTTIH